jgi:hypothetical protein
MKLSDLIMEDIENIHIKANGKVPNTKDKVNIDIDFTKMNYPQIEFHQWEQDTIGGKRVTRKKVVISFEDYDMNFETDKKQNNILSCLWEGQRSKRGE